MNDDEKIVLNRFKDLSNACYKRDIPVFTDFLDINRQTIFHNNIKEMPPVSWKVIGGYNLAERKLIVFLPYEDYPFQIPYDIIAVRAANPKFAEELNHRDYLGSLMNIGIAREKLGDIVVKDKTAYIFCLKSISQYVIENMAKVRHTIVNAAIIDEADFPDVEPEFKEISGTVASLRLDSVISLGFGSSRSKLINYIEGGNVSVNGRIITSNAYTLKPDDIISVRGLGKIRFIRSVTETKKGRTVVIINKYI